MEIIGYLLASLVGVSLGLVGSGGSILTVPILFYIMGVEPELATAYSLFIVGITALVGGIKNSIDKNINYRLAWVFGVPSIVAVYLTRAFFVPLLPTYLFSIGNYQLTKSTFLLLLFALVMIVSSFSMIRSQSSRNEKELRNQKFNFLYILAEGSVVGVLTGLVGAGGGFLIIPAMVILTGIPMKKAVGTSLLIIAAKSLIGFTGDLYAGKNIDWTLLGMFSFFSILGIFLGLWLAKRISGENLKKFFGWFVLAMGCYMIISQILKGIPY